MTFKGQKTGLKDEFGVDIKEGDTISTYIHQTLRKNRVVEYFNEVAAFGFRQEEYGNIVLLHYVNGQSRVIKHDN